MNDPSYNCERNVSQLLLEDILILAEVAIEIEHAPFEQIGKFLDINDSMSHINFL